MTTIAFKDGVMASESCQSHNYIDQVVCRKIYVVKGDTIGLAGRLTDFPKFLKWYREERDGFDDISGSSLDIEEIQALVYSNGKLYEYDDSCIAIPMSGSIAAIGSGSGYAMAALIAGASAEEAVNIACKLDPLSRPPVYSINAEDVSKGKAKRPKKYNGTSRTDSKKKE